MGKWNYGVILDAGSSGTRVHIYRWHKHKTAIEVASDQEMHRLPKVTTDKNWTLKTHPGISTFGERPDLVGPDHLKDLFDHARKIIPEDEQKHTPLFLLATAGMRLLPEEQKEHLLRNVCSYAQTTTNFYLPDCELHVQVIPGDTEGLYGWIAANYLLEGFDHPEKHNHGKGHHTYGFLDMGGASAQIAFAPNSTEAEIHANDLKMLRLRPLNGESLEYKVFTTTWLGFGANESRRRYVEALLAEIEKDGGMEYSDPCLPLGLSVTGSGTLVEVDGDQQEDDSPHLIGTGDFQECLKRTRPLLGKDTPCIDEPCLLNGVHVPSIDFDVNHFVGVSEYWHTTHEIFEMAHKDKAYDFKTYQERVSEFCGREWTSIKADVEAHLWGKKVDAKTAIEVCFKASWVINVLHDGFGIPRVGLEDMKGSHNVTKEVIDKAKQKGYLAPFQAINKIGDVEVSWTLGRMVLYASSQVPPAENMLAVGFGSNEPGIPSDFQPGGGTPELSMDPSGNDADWHDKLFKDSPRRIPGLIIFLLIVALAAYLLYARRRRSLLSTGSRSRRMGGSSSGLSRRRNLPFGLSILPIAGKFFSHSTSGPAYDRLEQGNLDEGEFELPDISGLSGADSDNGSVKGVSSGWATPQLTGSSSGTQLDSTHPLPFSTTHHAAHPASYFDSALGNSPYSPHDARPTTSVSNGANTLFPGNLMDRGGLLSRTESRDRLSPPSLAGSPKRTSRAPSPSRSIFGLPRTQSSRSLNLGGPAMSSKASVD